MKNIILRLVVTTFLIFSGLSVRQVAAATQIDIPGPTGSGQFGTQVSALPNGNIVVIDPLYDITSPTVIHNVGAVYLYNGATGALISRLTGSTANDYVGYANIWVLPSGNFVVISSNWDNGTIVDAGAVTWCSDTTGCTGVVSSDNSLVGSSANDIVGDGFRTLTILANGNYVVISPNWDNGGINNAGAITFCNGTTGCTGAVSPANSLVGLSANNPIGTELTILANGNYVVFSPFWDNGTIVDAGAVTWCSGTTGCTGVVSAANSLVGSTAGDYVGGGVAFKDVTVLPNDNYVVGSRFWNNGGSIDNAGAVTFCNGATGCRGVVSAANSLVGASATDFEDATLTILANGNYVVGSRRWNNGAINDAGAATLCNGTSGCTGAVSPANSLVGSSANDQVGYATTLTNGNYVVSSPIWNNGAIDNAGAVTLCNGTTGCTGVISAANSLVGTTANDYVGGRITLLTNGNYVVGSESWNNGGINDAGAATFCNGTTGCTGAVSAANSLVGSSVNDRVGDSLYPPVTGLTNGNYVVHAPFWNNGAIVDAGAVTFCNGTTGCTGVISAANSLVGSSEDDFVGGVIALTNGNYVVPSQRWNNGGINDAGAVTFCNGTTGCTGAISAANSLVGMTVGERVGYVATALTNGNYVAGSPYWDNGAAVNAGAVRWCNGTTGCEGALSSANSLIGSTAIDGVGSTEVKPLVNGNYVVFSPVWDNGSAVNAGAVTWCNGTSGCTGIVSAANSLVGSSANDYIGTSTGEFSLFPNLTPLSNGDYVIGSLSWDNGAIVNAGAISYLNGRSQTVGAITADNSVRGTTSNVGVYLPFSNLPFSFDTVNNQLVVGRPLDNIVTLFRQTRRPQFDFDGDGKSDISVYRPSNGVWYLQQSLNGFTASQFGISTDKLAPADFDGDGKTDLAVYRDGVWYLQRSTNGFTSVQFGLAEDLPTPADYDGDGKADIAVFRPSNGFWYRLNSSDGQFVAVQFGISEDKPTLGDFDGDNKADIAVFRPSNGVWYRLNSGNSQFVGFQFGIAEDKPSAADYDGDGRTDIAVYRPSNGVWYRLNSTNSQSASVQFGIAEDFPTPADYDGDGRADIAVFRPSNGIWYRLNSTNSQFLGVQFGIAEDKPIPSAYINSNSP